MHRNVYTLPRAAEAILGTLPLSLDARLIDLGCGNGVFLEAAGKLLTSGGPGNRDDAEQLSKVLTGVDSDASAISRARVALSRRFGPASWNLVLGDALELHRPGEFDFVVGNPPWVRLHHLEASRRSLLRHRFESAFGNFDLVYLFVEQGLRMLRAGGQLALVVPWGIKVQPAAAPIRRILSELGTWEVRRLPRDWFVPVAEIDPALLSLKKRGSTRQVAAAGGETLGDIAHVSTGVPTGADGLFLMDDVALRELALEPGWIRPVIRGRDVIEGGEVTLRRKIVWPYRHLEGEWVLRDTSSSAHVRRYLEQNRTVLEKRSRLRSAIEREPSSWYRFIDPARYQPDACVRVAVPDILRHPRYGIIRDSEVVILNTCFQVVPRPAQEARVLQTFEDPTFWERLLVGSRRLRNGYVRTSVSELRSAKL